MSTLSNEYKNSIAPALMTKFGYKSVMQIPKLEKVVINVGAGEAKDNSKVIDAILNDLSKITGQKGVPCRAKKSVANFKLREGMPIGAKVTLRGERAENFLRQALSIREMRVPEYSFDKEGNMSFGISDYTDFEGMKYDPEIGIFGMDISVVLRRPGARVSQRSLLKRRIPKSHRVDRDEAIQYMKDKFEVEVVQ